MQKTKMIFTIGPSSNSKEILREFIINGMNVARLNFSHGTHESHLEIINKIKNLREELNTSTAILADIKGPKIRTDKFKNDSVILEKGETFIFSCDKEILGDSTKCSISYKDLYKEVKSDDVILVDDGLLEFKVNKVIDKDIICTILTSGKISNHKGVNVPNVKIGLPAITEKDKGDLNFICKNDIDFIAASFIRKASDVDEYREVLKENGREDIKIISKIESTEGIENIDSIIEASDGIMIARGDMGVEIPLEQVPIVQKSIIKKCNIANKVVITATQLLDSMIRNPRPTRAEVTDVANAILDGTDAIMLSGESASGLYPLEAVKTMSKIAKDAETHLNYEEIINQFKNEKIENYDELISYSVAETAIKFPTKAIVVKVSNGKKVKCISRYRTIVPIIAVTNDNKLARSLSFEFGVIPVINDVYRDKDFSIIAREIVLENNIANKNDTILVIDSSYDNLGKNDLLKIETV